MHSLAKTRYHLIEAPADSVLENLYCGVPLYLNGRTPMAEITTVVPMSDSFLSDDDWFCFPEQNLHVWMPQVQVVHAIEVDHPLRPCLTLEVAARDEPSALSFAAIGNSSERDAFRKGLAKHPARELTAKQYEKWRLKHFAKPHQCPCCEEAAEIRRKAPGNSPIALIFADAIRSRRSLHCRAVAKSFQFGVEMMPSELLVGDERIGVAGEDQSSMIEIDPGICYSMVIRENRIDDAPFTSVYLSNSMGITELVIETPGFESARKWADLCRK
ncbi:hypothetical protein JIN85_00330 [Luteolibacter pohnpeiensis]|uniref:Uncharacterized protein n=1 Tax=Luteolibacter pohnpeiensis TaxID=454153 RepID=A0A934VU78_9BACT|nr:hypothetical protein [Luteolibacter pohnpeiensis]MBK1880835.1 hypothetical protein [Luteolibacter pohnpeiensis]